MRFAGLFHLLLSGVRSITRVDSLNINNVNIVVGTDVYVGSLELYRSRDFVETGSKSIFVFSKSEKNIILSAVLLEEREVIDLIKKLEMLLT